MTTAMTGSDLWTRIQDFGLSDPSAKVSFESKLADECGWTLGHAHVATHEYRRFLYLTQIADQPMCPSRDVDCAWHLHLTQTRSYRLLCESVLGRFLHHDASKEGPTELAKHKAMYGATLEVYQSTFGEPPPREIWPAVEARFGTAQPLQTESVWRFPEALMVGRTFQVLLVAAAVGLAWLNDWMLGDVLWNRISDVAFGMAYTLALVGVAFGVLTMTDYRARRVSRPPAVDAYESAWLVGGAERVLGAAVVGLVHRGLLELIPERKGNEIAGARCRRTAKETDLGQLDRIERACLQAMPEGDIDIGNLRGSLAETVSAVPRRLEKAGLLLRVGEIESSRAIAAMLTFVVLVIGLSRLGRAISGEPFALHPLCVLIGFNLYLLLRLVAMRSRPSMVGLKILADMTTRHDKLKAEALSASVEPSPRYLGTAALVTLAFALFGTQAVMTSEAFAGINFVFGEDKTNLTGNSGSSAGCGSDAGCGGCGGCGG